MSFYKSPAFNSGYVIPRYVQAEPPERGTITTQWLPRGTIPEVLPDYLAVPKNQIRQRSTLAKHSLSGSCFDEGTLQGHSLAGDTLGAVAYELEPLGSGKPPLGPSASFSRYGAKVAKDLMARAKRLPTEHRATFMKKTLGAIDKTLPARAEQHARAEQQRGAPAPVALERGIARAVSEGAITEIGKLGSRARGGRPQALSGALRGRGRRPHALGGIALTSTKAGLDVAPVVVTMDPAGGTSSGQCSPDGQFVWIPATASSPGYWQRLAAGQTCQGFTIDPTQSPDVRVHTGPQPVVIPTTPASYRVVQVGPFQFPADLVWSRATWWGKALPLDWQAEIKRIVSKDPSSGFTMKWIGAPEIFTMIPPSTPINTSYFGSAIEANPKWAPIARTTHPDTGKDYGIWIAVTHRYSDKPADPVTNPAVVNMIFAPVQKTTWGSIWDWITNIASSIVDAVGDALDAVKNATCSLLTQPGIDQAAVSAAAATPSVATAGVAAGVVVGTQLCGGAKAPPGPPDGSAAGGGLGGWLVPAAIGGGLLLVFALTR